jgi:hypothetical protein
MEKEIKPSRELDLTNQEESKEKLEKENKAKELIDNMQGDLKQYIDNQMAAIPNLINTSINDSLQQIIPQLQQNQQAAPAAAPDSAADKMAMIGQLAPILGQVFGGGQQAAPQSNIFQDMIMQSFVKMIQAKVDETVMGTYGVRVPPPANVIEPQQQAPQNNGLNIE